MRGEGKKQENGFVYCLDTSPTTQSRTLTILDWLQKQGIRHDYLKPTFTPSKYVLTKRLAKRLNIGLVQCGLIDGIAFLLTALPRLAKERISHKGRVIAIICFESWHLYPYIWVYKRVLGYQIIVDYGYPAVDRSSVSIPQGYKEEMMNIEESLNHKGLCLLVETPAQVERVMGMYSKPSVLTHYVLKSTGLTEETRSVTRVPVQDFSESQEYILFRGTLNEESGILDAIDEFLLHTSENAASELILLIHGRGFYEKEIKKVVNECQRIRFCSDYLPSHEIERMMLEASAIIGQFNMSSQRTKVTIPHKFIESLTLNKLFMTPCHIPLESYLSRLLPINELNKIRESSSPLRTWLELVDSKTKILSAERIRKASKSTLDSMKETNTRSLRMVVSNPIQKLQ